MYTLAVGHIVHLRVAFFLFWQQAERMFTRLTFNWTVTWLEYVTQKGQKINSVLIIASYCFVIIIHCCPLTVVLPHIFFNLTTLFSYPLFFCLFRAPLDVVVHLLVFLRSFRFESVLSQFSPFVAQIKNFCSDPIVLFVCFFSFWRCLPRIPLAVSVIAVSKVVIIESMSVSSLLMMVRDATFPPFIAWEVSNTLGFFSFSRSNVSLMCFGSLILFRRRWKVIITKSWSLPMSAPGKLRVLALFTPGRKRFLARMWSIWLWCCPIEQRQVHLLDALWWPKVYTNTRSLKVANSRSLSPLSFVSSLQKGQKNALPIFTSILAHCFFNSSIFAQQECPSSVPDQ